MIIKPYTSGTMRTGWRIAIESAFHELARETIGSRWQAAHVPLDYSRPRQELDGLLSAVRWLHPSAPDSNSNGNSPHGVGFYVPRNLRLIYDCDLVLSCIVPDCASIDSAHEIGIAFAVHKPIITVDLTHGSPDYGAWRAMSLVILDSLEDAAKFLLFQVQDVAPSTSLEQAVAAVGDKLNSKIRVHPNGFQHAEIEPCGENCTI